jgi:hypothetical protein
MNFELANILKVLILKTDLSNKHKKELNKFYSLPPIP